MANAVDDVNSRGERCAVARRLVCLALCLAPVVAHGHPEWSPIRVNRYAKVVLGPRVRLVYTLLHGEGPALAARKSADLDADGRLDEKEKALLGRRAASAVAAGLHVTVDGAPIVLASPTIDVGLVGNAVAPEPYSVDLTYAISLGAPGTTHELGLDDRVEVPNEGDTEVSVEESPDAVLVGSYRGRRPAAQAQLEKQKLFTFRGPRFSQLEDRSVTLRVASVAQRRATPLVAAIAGLLLVSVGSLLFVRRRRRAGRRRASGA